MAASTRDKHIRMIAGRYPWSERSTIVLQLLTHPETIGAILVEPARTRFLYLRRRAKNQRRRRHLAARKRQLAERVAA